MVAGCRSTATLKLYNSHSELNEVTINFSFLI